MAIKAGGVGRPSTTNHAASLYQEVLLQTVILETVCWLEQENHLVCISPSRAELFQVKASSVGQNHVTWRFSLDQLNRGLAWPVLDTTTV